MDARSPLRPGVPMQRTFLSQVVVGYVVAMLVVALVFVYRVTPASGIGEGAHFRRALQISEGHLFALRVAHDHYGGRLDGRLLSYMEYFEDQRDRGTPSSSGAAQDRAYMADHAASGRRFSEFGSTASYPPLPYLGSAIGLAIAKAGHAGVATRLMAGRLGQLGLFALMLLVVLPYRRLSALVLLTTPTALHLASTYSADPVTNTLCLLFVGLCLRCRTIGAVSRREAVALILLGGGMGLLKLTCCVLSAAILLVPTRAFPAPRDALRVRLMTIGLSVALAVLWNGFFPFVPGHYWQTGGDPHLVLAYSVHHPLTAVQIFWVTFREGLQWWWLDVYGRFGGAPVPQFFKLGAMSSLAALAIAALLAVCDVSGRPAGHDPSRWTREKGDGLASLGLVVLAALYTGATLAAFYVGFSPAGHAPITGLQGRYFLLPLILLALAISAARPAALCCRMTHVMAVPALLMILAAALALHVSLVALGRFALNWH
ncbi:DUF2142 domain-containing protein [Tanticharoenia sakaeratensis]|nr:DUF2142 domain-containing protein [Tanticharoenia sakaeratensis]GBQ25127.1 membrane protein [Tanticharoenia sakaeratensis NBRC 103193]